MNKTAFDNFPPELKQAFAALALAQADTQRQIDATSAAIEKAQADTQRQIDATTATVEKTSRGIDKLNKLYGSMANNQGDIAEEFFYNSLLQEPVIGKLKFDKIMTNIQVGSKGKDIELDLLLINGNSLAVVEVKSKCHIKDVDQLERGLKFLRKSSPEYKGFQFFGGIAGFSIPKDVAHEAHERGFFVLKRHGKLMTSNTQGMTAF